MGRIGLRAFVAAGLLGLYASACSREKRRREQAAAPARKRFIWTCG